MVPVENNVPHIEWNFRSRAGLWSALDALVGWLVGWLSPCPALAVAVVPVRPHLQARPWNDAASIMILTQLCHTKSSHGDARAPGDGLRCVSIPLRHCPHEVRSGRGFLIMAHAHGGGHYVMYDLWIIKQASGGSADPPHC